MAANYRYIYHPFQHILSATETAGLTSTGTASPQTHGKFMRISETNHSGHWNNLAHSIWQPTSPACRAFSDVRLRLAIAAADAWGMI